MDLGLNELYNEIILLRKELRDLKEDSTNHIQIADFIVTSNNESLEECEKTINRLVDKHLKFSQERARNLIKNGGASCIG